MLALTISYAKIVWASLNVQNPWAFGSWVIWFSDIYCICDYRDLEIPTPFLLTYRSCLDNLLTKCAKFSLKVSKSANIKKSK